MNDKIYIIGDVHGCYKTLMALVNELPENAKLCFVGDLVDKGSNSKDVIEFIKSNNYDCVLGNHEKKMYESIPEIIQDMNNKSHPWLTKYEGEATLKSYDDINLLKEHAAWLEKLPLYIEYRDLKTKDGRYLVVSHSHILNSWKYRDYPKDSLEYKSFENECLVSRYKNHDNKKIFNVFGHTPLPKPQIENHKANIDLGCFFNDGNTKGSLCALGFPSMDIFVQENIE